MRKTKSKRLLPLIYAHTHTCISYIILEIITQFIRPTESLKVPSDITSSCFVSISEHLYSFGVCLTYFRSKTLSSSVVKIFK